MTEGIKLRSVVILLKRMYSIDAVQADQLFVKSCLEYCCLRLKSSLKLNWRRDLSDWCVLAAKLALVKNKACYTFWAEILARFMMSAKNTIWKWQAFEPKREMCQDWRITYISTQWHNKITALLSNSFWESGHMLQEERQWNITFGICIFVWGFSLCSTTPSCSVL